MLAPEINGLCLNVRHQKMIFVFCPGQLRLQILAQSRTSPKWSYKATNNQVSSHKWMIWGAEKTANSSNPRKYASHSLCANIYTDLQKKSEMMIADDSQTSDLDLMPVSKYRSTLNFLLNKANIHFKELRASPRFHSQAAWGEISPAELWKESFLLSWNISKMR